MEWNAMNNVSGNMVETSVTDFFTLPKLGRVYQCLEPTMPQKWSDRVEIDAHAREAACGRHPRVLWRAVNKLLQR